jgi:hypothetical protein
VAELEALAATHELTVVSAGKGEIVKLFERDAGRSPFDRPMRALALTYVKGMAPRTPFSRVCFNLIPGEGEYFVFPALTTSGPCEIMVFEGIPGGPMDGWADAKTPEQHLKKSLEILQTYAPWEAERCRHVEITDDNGTLAGRFANHPQARGHPPSGATVFGMGDPVCVPHHRPGLEQRDKAFKVVHDSIVARGSGAFDAAWMNATFERYWDYAQHVVNWTNSLLTPPPHILTLLGAAGQIPAIAPRIANNFNNPPDFFPWWTDAAECERFVDRHAALARATPRILGIRMARRGNRIAAPGPPPQDPNHANPPLPLRRRAAGRQRHQLPGLRRAAGARGPPGTGARARGGARRLHPHRRADPARPAPRHPVHRAPAVPGGAGLRGTGQGPARRRPAVLQHRLAHGRAHARRPPPGAGEVARAQRAALRGPAAWRRRGLRRSPRRGGRASAADLLAAGQRTLAPASSARRSRPRGPGSNRASSPTSRARCSRPGCCIAAWGRTRRCRP